MFTRLFVALTCACLAACVATVDPITRNAPLKMALTEPTEALEARAAAGDRQAQYAVSFLARMGLRGVARDPIRAEGLRAQAGENLSRSQPLYMPGVNGAPGTLIYAQINDPGVSDAEAGRLDVCGLAVLMGHPATGGMLCGSPEAYIDLLPAASAVRLEMAASQTPLIEPEHVIDCAGTDPLWSDASRRLNASDTGGATAATDRIITLCGTGSRSWHARVMRSVLALQAGEASMALTLLEPVPSPAPAPIGAFGDHVRIAALDSLGRPADAAEARTALAAASLAALRTEASETGRSVETRPLGTASAVIFDRPVGYFPGIRSLKTIVVTGEPARLTAYQLTRHGEAGKEEGPWFLDAFACDRRATVQVFETEPALDQIVARIDAYRRDAGLIVSSMIRSGDMTSGVCQWPVQTAPALGDDPTRREASEATDAP
ncbi:hypothetical protein BZG35_00015 [Brevundimonas sp. LM2]|uniref:hypothetical protein n=1 Tax=Brevundimonas sp. LM2 TaxID=1938605 RepID=UPI000983B19E|nr:hypothetical protein [Brevundimonas sp. LM2]AQR60221.1 hypothetical protein BZG35_00015 [Brevundimonas sp. LM2]